MNFIISRFCYYVYSNICEWSKVLSWITLYQSREILEVKGSKVLLSGFVSNSFEKKLLGIKAEAWVFAHVSRC